MYTEQVQIVDHSSGVARNFVRGGGGASNKIFRKVAWISVRGGDIQQKFTQQRLWKIYIKFAQKFKTSLQNCSEIKFNQILKHLGNFQNFNESVEHLK